MGNVYGKVIQQIREEKNLSRETVADRSLMDPQLLQQVEEGNRELSYPDLVLIANFLEVSAMALREERIIQKADLLDLDDFFAELEEKLAALQESVREMQEAAAALGVFPKSDIIKEIEPETKEVSGTEEVLEVEEVPEAERVSKTETIREAEKAPKAERIPEKGGGQLVRGNESQRNICPHPERQPVL